MSDFFKVHYRSKTSKARLGTLTTAHGVVSTPAFVPVATKGSLKSLKPQDAKGLHIDISFVNTYHLVTHPGPHIIANAGGIHKYSQLDCTLMSDSGGFQVFSLAQRKHENMPSPIKLVKIDEDGVLFRSTYDGALMNFNPEASMRMQKQIGADIVMAFDECLPYPLTRDYAIRAVKRTNRWLQRSIMEFYSSPLFRDIQPYRQYMYGIIQGGFFEDILKEAAEYVVAQSVDGIAIGGVSVGEGKKALREQMTWVAPLLPVDRPVHLLGIGHIDDILDLVSSGIDTFDCVEPTRLARLGTMYRLDFPDIYSREYIYEEVDITKAVFKDDMRPASEDKDSPCHAYTYSYLHHLFKQRELLGYTLLTEQNLYIMQKLMRQIRHLISIDKI